MYSSISGNRPNYKKFIPDISIDVYALGKTFMALFNETVGNVSDPTTNYRLPAILDVLIRDPKNVFPLPNIFTLIKGMISIEPKDRITLDNIIKGIDAIMEDYRTKDPFKTEKIIADLVGLIKQYMPKLDSFKKKYLKYKKKYIELKKLKF